MTNAITSRQNADAANVMEQVVIQGDLEKLTPEMRVNYYMRVCESVGLNPYTKPFDYIRLNNKLTLYALKGATDQLRRIHGVSARVVSQERIDDVLVVTVEATDKAGRIDTEIGAVSVGNLKGDALANAMMKALTKAKRRVTLSICGLGMLDESEVETIPSAQHTDYIREIPTQPASDTIVAGTAEVIDTETGEIQDGPTVADQLVDELDGMSDRRDLVPIQARIIDAGLIDDERVMGAYYRAYERITGKPHAKAPKPQQQLV